MKKYVMHWEKFTKITSKNKHTFSKNALILINCILISRYFNFLKYLYFFIFEHALLLPNHDIISINFKLVIQFPKCSITIHNHPTFNARITSKISEHERSRALTVVACERSELANSNVFAPLYESWKRFESRIHPRRFVCLDLTRSRCPSNDVKITRRNISGNSSSSPPISNPNIFNFASKMRIQPRILRNSSRSSFEYR